MENLSFEELEALVKDSIKKLSSDNVSLEESVKIYNESVENIEKMKQKLDEIAAKLSIINE